MADHATNSLAVLAAHIAGAEHFWIGEVSGGRPPMRDLPAKFEPSGASGEELCRLLEHSGEETRAVFADLDEAGLATARQVEGQRVPVR